ncbi:DUF4232 domain-containing protein [Streptomyces sp. S465]|uniref:DUF4232 domain-containing protein n=1 Tax=Streptomyces sp. S465 TaxID=2979468 RepID=UPI0022A87D88|nr:DUF4232 domain-containing protein [Streptomyces sp. S465]WAP57194.1 DUF4232 domain-containing protein [Streptomyces sp. S465]
MPLTTARLAHRVGTLRSVAAGLTVVAAGITLAACGTADASGVKTAGRADSMAAAVPTAHEDGAQEAGPGAVADGGADAGAQGGLRADGGVEEEAGVCDPGAMSVGVISVPRPANHLLMEITNQSGTPCRLTGFPVVRFDGADSAVPAAGDTRPQTVVTLAPGGSGYAGLTTTSAADAPAGGTRLVTGLTVALPGDESRRTVDLPGDSVEIDGGAEIGYWQSDASDALLW